MQSPFYVEEGPYTNRKRSKIKQDKQKLKKVKINVDLVIRHIHVVKLHLG